MKKAMVLFVLIFVFQSSYGQFGNILRRATDRAIDRTADKLEQKIEDKVVEAVSDEIARRAFKPINQAVDDMMKDRYQDSVGHDVDWSKAGEAYGEFLSGMNKAIGDIPDEYVFDVTTDVEMVDEKGEKNTLKMMYAEGGNFMGFQTQEGKGLNTVVFDIENDAFVMFNEDKKGKKTGQVVPSMLNLASSFTSSAIEKEVGEYSIEKKGKGKKYAGYSTTKYLITSEDYITESHVANDFPIKWSEAYKAFCEQFAPSMKNDASMEQFGIVMYSKTKSKKNKSKVTTSTVVKVSSDKVKFGKSEYAFPGA